MLKKFKWKIHTYVFTCCVCTKSFYEKPTCHLTYVKKTNFDAKKKTLYYTCFVFFTPTTCNVIFLQNFYERIWIMKMYMWNFSFKFFNTQKYKFFGIGSICTWEPNWISAKIGITEITKRWSLWMPCMCCYRSIWPSRDLHRKPSKQRQGRNNFFQKH
jgi:hypothetical protein